MKGQFLRVNRNHGEVSAAKISMKQLLKQLKNYRRALHPTVWLAITALLFSLPHSGDAAFTFTKIADTNTPIPGGVGNFTSFGSWPSIDGVNVAFRGFGSSGQQGIYTRTNASLTKVADTNTPIPGGRRNFTFFYEPSLDSGNVAFVGYGTGQRGVYAHISGALTMVANTRRGTTYPGSAYRRWLADAGAEAVDLFDGRPAPHDVLIARIPSEEVS